MSVRRKLAHRLASEDGFTMLFALAALFIGALLVAAAFSAANGDLQVTHRATIQEKAYYAAVAGVDRYQYQLTSKPEYWTTCPMLGSKAKPLTVTGAAEEGYYVTTLGATGKTCEGGKQATILESGNTANGTFRILSTGTVTEGNSTVTRKIVATFAHPGFTKYVYESNYEVEDPVNFGLSPGVCEFYYAERLAKGLTTKCPPIEFAPEDKVNGPMHTNDAAEVCASGGNAPTFGRTSSDEIQMNGGHYAANGCSNAPNIVGKYTEKAGSVLPPATDVELLEAAGKKFEGRTEIELKSGTPNTMLVSKPGTAPEPVPFPNNGVVYVENSKTAPCAVTNYTPFNSDTTHDAGCGNVYVHGKYTESLTIASADDVIVNGNLETTNSPTSTPPGEPTGSATLGLIAENFVRVYHPVKSGYTTTNIKPAEEPALNGKCVTVKEVSARVHRNEVTEVATTGLKEGYEVEGTVAGQIKPPTTISKIGPGETIKLSEAAKVSAAELKANITRSTEVTGVETSTLKLGDEVEGTVAGQTEGTTVIAEIKTSEKSIKLSKATKQSVKELTASTHSSVEVTNITTTGLVAGDEIEGSGIPSKTVVTEVKPSAIKLSKPATRTESNIKLKFYGEATKLKFYGETTKLKILVPTGSAYNSTLGFCHKVESNPPYTEYIASENLYIAGCEEATYEGKAFCKYENNSGTCAKGASNLSAIEDPNHWGAIENLVIDAAILSTKHSWIVDNYKCGKQLGKLTVWGSIAQFWRGPVGTASGTGYIKNYNYDNRLADQQPPSFLAPTNATSWKVVRETAPPTTFTG